MKSSAATAGRVVDYGEVEVGSQAMLFRAPETHSRSFIKAVSWRALGSIDTFVLSYIFSGQLVLAASIASTETVTKVILFYLHERAWARVPWGRADKVVAAKAPSVAPVVTPVEAEAAA